MECLNLDQIIQARIKKNYFADIAEIYLNQTSSEKIGGRKCIVEIDETKIIKGQSNRGRLTIQEETGEWGFGGICRQTKAPFFCIVPDRTKATLISKLVENVVEGTHIISDYLSSYNNISDYGYTHSKVNNSKIFLNPKDPNIHTQTIERAWRGLKNEIPKSSPYEMRYTYLSLYEFKKRTKWFGH